MPLVYSHRQFGRVVFWIGIGVGLLVAGIFAMLVASGRGREQRPIVWLLAVVPGLVATAALLLFAWMQVSVTDSEVRWAFGRGAPNFSVPLRDITHVEEVRASLLAGIGIHLTPKGWLYNVSVGPAVAVTTPRRTVLIGTDDPTGLMSAIEATRDRAQAAR